MYSDRIQYIMFVPTIKNIYKQFKVKNALTGELEVPTAAEAKSGVIAPAKLAD